MIAVVLSGGSGTRLWPISRDSYPKQFCELFDQSFLLSTLRRVENLGELQIVTLKTMGELTNGVLRTLGRPADLVLEPIAKNTAPAVALAVWRALKKGAGEKVMGIFPADHLIVNDGEFQSAAKVCEALAAKGEVVTMGIRPRYAAAGYGYIQISSQAAKGGGAKVVKFHEKPPLAMAEKYIADKNYFWNAGLFFFQVKVMAALFEKYMPELWRKISSLKEDLSNLDGIYPNVSGQSLDYGIMEKLSSEMTCVPVDFGWSDVGSWDEIARLQEERMNVASQAQVIAVESTDNFIYSSHPKVIGLSGVENLIVVDTPDALLVTRRGHSEKVKDLVQAVRAAQRPEAAEHRFEIRPWGKFEVLADNGNHKVKRLTINPQSQLSYQMHERRTEHWVVISGEAEILVDQKTTVVKAGEQVYVPKSHKHRISNKGREPLVIIEVQTGDYFGEDDIQRFADDYNRN